jgi:hypothetical protein
MMRVLYASLGRFVLFVSGCSSNPPAPSARVIDSLASLENSRWEFVETDSRNAVVHRYRFALTGQEAHTCLAGKWRMAELLSARSPEVSRPAYRYEDGKLELLLSTDWCDAYNSFTGRFEQGNFVGKHVSYGLDGGVEHGNVTATPLR